MLCYPASGSGNNLKFPFSFAISRQLNSFNVIFARPLNLVRFTLYFSWTTRKCWKRIKRSAVTVVSRDKNYQMYRWNRAFVHIHWIDSCLEDTTPGCNMSVSLDFFEGNTSPLPTQKKRISSTPFSFVALQRLGANYNLIKVSYDYYNDRNIRSV